MPSGTDDIRPNPSQLERLLAVVKGEKDRVWSIIVATVDPDGLGTAMILKALIVHLGGRAEIFYGGAFSHPQNETLWNIFELEKHLHPLDELPGDGPLVLADSCKIEDSRFHKKLDRERFRLIVDHHRDRPVEDENRFVYVVSCGAAATLGFLLVEALNGQCGKPGFPTEPLVLSEDVATLAAIGILSDTDCLTALSVKTADHEAHGKLMRLGAQDKIAESFSYELPSRFYEIQSQCLKAVTVVGSYLITRPDTLISAKEEDFLGIIADDLRKREGIKTVVVWGMTDSILRASIRTKSKELNLNTFIAEIFGVGHGGGKNGSGGARASLPELLLPTATTVGLLIAVFDASFREKLERRVGTKVSQDEGAHD